jgi:hypothetical protein
MLLGKTGTKCSKRLHFKQNISLHTTIPSPTRARGKQKKCLNGQPSALQYRLYTDKPVVNAKG